MDAAEYQRHADQLGAGPEETTHALAGARWDIAHQPERGTDDDPYAAAAQALAASRIPRQAELAEISFQCHSWTPGGLTPALYGPTPADRFMQWYEQATAGRH